MPWSVTTPTQRPSSSQSDRTFTSSTTSIRGWFQTWSASTSEIAFPVSAPPAWTMRRSEWPPSRPRSSSNSTPSATRSAIRAGASSVSTATALSRQSPRPARNVSAAWSAGVVALADRGSDPALRVPAVRGGDRRLREQQHVRLGGGVERGGQVRRRPRRRRSGRTVYARPCGAHLQVLSSQSITWRRV